MNEEKKKSILSSASQFLSGTMLSRITGIARDVSMAMCFGTHPSVAALMMAFRFSYLLRRLFGDGALHSVFVPQYETCRLQSAKEGIAFFKSLWLSLSLFLVLIIILAELFFFSIRPFLSLDSKLVLDLSISLFPSILFVCSYALNTSLLQCHERFFLPAFAPCAFNLVWVFAALSLRHLETTVAMRYMAFYLLIAAIMQWLVTLIPVLGYLRADPSGMNFKAVKKIAKPLSLAVLGMGASQINSALDSLFARYADLEGPAYLWYAVRIQQFPLAIIGLALSQALLPPLSRAASKKGKEFYQLLNFSLDKSFKGTFVFFSMLFVLAGPSIQVMYARGDFSEFAAQQTMQCLWAYLLGLIPSVWVNLLATSLYAEKDYRSPMIASLLSVFSNIVLNAIMVFVLGMDSISVALATSISAFINLFFMLYQQKGAAAMAWKVFISNASFMLVLILISALTALLGVYCFEDKSFLDKTLQRQGFLQSLYAFLAELGSFTFLFGIYYFFYIKKRD